MLKKNVGKTDGIVRIVLGVLLLLAIILPKMIVALLALGIIGSGLIGYCGLYSVFGVNTCPIESPTTSTEIKDIQPEAENKV